MWKSENAIFSPQGSLSLTRGWICGILFESFQDCRFLGSRESDRWHSFILPTNAYGVSCCGTNQSVGCAASGRRGDDEFEASLKCPDAEGWVHFSDRGLDQHAWGPRPISYVKSKCTECLLYSQQWPKLIITNYHFHLPIIPFSNVRLHLIPSLRSGSQNGKAPNCLGKGQGPHTWYRNLTNDPASSSSSINTQATFAPN